MAKTSDKKIHFEESLESIREIIMALESGDLTLEDSIAAYQDGSKRIEQCRTLINDAEIRITELSREDDAGQ